MNHSLMLLINNDLDKLFKESLEEWRKHDGKPCPQCGFIQGSPSKGWKKFYCKHLEKEIEEGMNAKEKQLLEDIGRCIEGDATSREKAK